MRHQQLKMERYLFHLTFQPRQKISLSWLIDIPLCVGQIVETVVMNPPFGTRRKGADMDFLSSAMKVRWCSPYNWYPRFILFAQYPVLLFELALRPRLFLD